MSEFKWFEFDDFKCSETGENKMDGLFIRKLDRLRDMVGFPLIVNSGYRSTRHSIEAAKDSPGMHTTGRAADLRVADGIQRRALVAAALSMQFGGIGVASGFVHVDDRQSTPVMWTYG